MNKLNIAALTMAASLLFSNLAFATGEEEPPQPPKQPPAGCTPGYWKNHLDSWVTYEPYYGISETIEVPPELYAEFVNVSLLDALQLKGGPDVAGAARILLRHTVAALLNMRHPDVNYPLDKEQIKGPVNVALASLDRDRILTVATFLATQNEIGCPLN